MACLVSALSSPVLMNMWYPLSSLHQSWSQVLQPHCRERPSVSELQDRSGVRLVRVPGPALSPLYHGASHLEAFQGFGADALNRLPGWPQTEDAGGEPGSLGPLLVQVGHPFAAHISVSWVSHSSTVGGPSLGDPSMDRAGQSLLLCSFPSWSTEGPSLLVEPESQNYRHTFPAIFLHYWLLWGLVRSHLTPARSLLIFVTSFIALTVVPTGRWLPHD